MYREQRHALAKQDILSAKLDAIPAINDTIVAMDENKEKIVETFGVIDQMRQMTMTALRQSRGDRGNTTTDFVESLATRGKKVKGRRDAVPRRLSQAKRVEDVVSALKNLKRPPRLPYNPAAVRPRTDSPLLQAIKRARSASNRKDKILEAPKPTSVFKIDVNRPATTSSSEKETVDDAQMKTVHSFLKEKIAALKKEHAEEIERKIRESTEAGETSGAVEEIIEDVDGDNTDEEVTAITRHRPWYSKEFIETFDRYCEAKNFVEGMKPKAKSMRVELAQTKQMIKLHSNDPEITEELTNQMIALQEEYSALAEDISESKQVVKDMREARKKEKIRFRELMQNYHEELKMRRTTTSNTRRGSTTMYTGDKDLDSLHDWRHPFLHIDLEAMPKQLEDYSKEDQQELAIRGAFFALEGLFGGRNKFKELVEDREKERRIAWKMKGARERREKERESIIERQKQDIANAKAGSQKHENSNTGKKLGSIAKLSAVTTFTHLSREVAERRLESSYVTAANELWFILQGAAMMSISPTDALYESHFAKAPPMKEMSLATIARLLNLFVERVFELKEDPNAGFVRAMLESSDYNDEMKKLVTELRGLNKLYPDQEDVIAMLKVVDPREVGASCPYNEDRFEIVLDNAGDESEDDLDLPESNPVMKNEEELREVMIQRPWSVPASKLRDAMSVVRTLNLTFENRSPVKVGPKAPTLSQIMPSDCFVSTRTHLELLGAGFTAPYPKGDFTLDPEVNFIHQITGNVYEGTHVAVLEDHRIACNFTPKIHGYYDVRVSIAGVESNVCDQKVYVAGPLVEDIQPKMLSRYGGEWARITGTGLCGKNQEDLQVYFDGVEASEVVELVPGKEILARVPKADILYQDDRSGDGQVEVVITQRTTTSRRRASLWSGMTSAATTSGSPTMRKSGNYSMEHVANMAAGIGANTADSLSRLGSQMMFTSKLRRRLGFFTQTDGFTDETLPDEVVREDRSFTHLGTQFQWSITAPVMSLLRLESSVTKLNCSVPLPPSPQRKKFQSSEMTHEKAP